MDMKMLVKIALLATVLVIVFFSPAQIGVGFYYSLFPLLFLLAYLFYIVSYWVSKKDVKRQEGSEPTFSIFCGKVPQIGGGDLERGRLIVADGCLRFYRRVEKDRSRQHPCYLAWTLEVAKIQSLGVGPVLSIRRGIVFYLDEGDVRFVHARAKARKASLLQALGWSSVPTVPQQVEVSSEAAKAPSFSELAGRKDNSETDADS